MGRAPGTRTPYTGAKEIHWVRDSAEYRACAIQAFAWASRLAEEGAKNETSGTWAVVVDADETVLDNSQFQKEVGSEGFTPAKWDAWVRREEAVAIPGAIAFLNRVHELGGVVAVVTNRKATEQSHTESNFHKAGIPYDLMLCQTNDHMKDARFEAVQKGTAAPGVGPLKVLVFCGDNIQDFPNQRQEIRFQPEAAMSDWGKKYIAIPNPMYGTWVNNPER
jgi:5'-nucleotidase (lipoprotein e(P4) family)